MNWMISSWKHLSGRVNEQTKAMKSWSSSRLTYFRFRMTDIGRNSTAYYSGVTSPFLFHSLPGTESSLFTVSNAESGCQVAPSRPDPRNKNQRDDLLFRISRGLALTVTLSVGRIEVVVDEWHPASPQHVALVGSIFSAL
jgi:hypothetical protein